MLSLSPAAFFNASIIFFFPGITIYSGSKPFSISMPIFDFGRSIMWPIEEETVKFFPSILFMVLAFAGDSTITNDLAILISNPHEILARKLSCEFFNFQAQE